MKKFVMLYLLVTLVVCLFFKERVNAELAYPYDNASYTCSGEGVRASRNSGGYLNKTERDQFSIIYWIGTTPSSLILDFETSFFDGTGDDFAILTSSEGWGHLADAAQFSFFLDGALQGTFDAHLSPDHLHEFELPGDSIIADRIVITNITPDLPGVNNDATMAFIDAGVAYLVPEPATLLLLGMGGLLMRKRK